MCPPGYLRLVYKGLVSTAYLPGRSCIQKVEIIRKTVTGGERHEE